MQTIEIFDRHDAAQRPASFGEDLNWARDNGAQIQQHDLKTSGMSERVRGFFKDEKSLPIILVNGVLALQSRYPSRNELANWAQIPKAEAVFAKVSCCSGGKCY